MKRKGENSISKGLKRHGFAKWRGAAKKKFDSSV